LTKALFGVLFFASPQPSPKERGQLHLVRNIYIYIYIYLSTIPSPLERGWGRGPYTINIGVLFETIKKVISGFKTKD